MNIPQAMEAAVAHHQAGRLDEAARIYEQVLAAVPGHTDALHLLGLVDAARGNHEQALQRVSLAIQLNPSQPLYHSNLGRLLKETNRLDQAEAAYRAAVRLDPSSADALVGLGVVLKSQERCDEAATWLRRAIDHHPRLTTAHMHLGGVMRAAGDLDAAENCYRQALQIEPDHARAHCNLGSVLRLQGTLPEAADHCRRAIEIRPGYEKAHLNLGIILLALGDFEAGWPEYEWRLKVDASAVSARCQPLWDGSPLEGKTIMLFLEQGTGDVLQFIRYVPLLRQRGATVLVECPSGLAPILQLATVGIDRLVLRDSQFPPFDVACPLLSLPGILRTTPETIPCDVPYLQVDPDLVETWRKRMEALGGFRVGIAWKGNKNYPDDRWRSMALAEFEPLSRVVGVTLISLQKGDGAEEVGRSRFPVIDWTDEMDQRCGPFMDTAAVMKHLDLVITCDSAMGHLAGALGVPTWIALSAVPDWRWGLDRNDSPWYPTVRLFRQREMGNWSDVFHEMAALAEQAGTRVASQTARESPPQESSPAAPCPSIHAEVSPGELIDKITILQIKAERINDPAKRRNVTTELHTLEQTRDRSLARSTDIEQLTEQLKAVNEALWDVEDEVRECERQQQFGERFVELARSVYRHNDRRSLLKRQINTLLGSPLVEEKSYDLPEPSVGVQRAPNEPADRPSGSAGQSWLDTGPVRLKKCRYGPMLYLAKDRYIGQSLDTYGEFSQGEMELLGQVVRPGQVVLDVGANIGTHTVFLAQTVGPAGRVYAFEPQRVLFQILCGNTALNALTNVDARLAAVGRQPGTVCVPTPNYAGSGNFGGISLDGRTRGEPVPMLTIDGLNLPACHLVKIDVEGMEGEVLAGAEHTIGRYRPVLYLENDRQEKSPELIRQLFGLGYRLYWHLPPLYNPANFCGEIRNLFSNIISANMLAIHRSASQNISLREILSPDDHWAGN